MKYLIAGLGNIGAEYHETRHNIGFMVVDNLAKQYDAAFSFEKYAYVCELKHKGRTMCLIKPTTYMNLSGKAVQYWMQQYKIPLENLLVVVDDVALPFGKMRLRPSGSSAGHNGLKDIEAVLGTQNYARLRFGIGNHYPKGKQAEYVLSKFNPEEMAEIPALLQKAREIVLSFCTVGITLTMNQYNGQ
ncbi:MAG: aminoacyl-tRNA hydrolase [Cytophagales bacterium]|nr:aminoacyl-tRNA hydrolase [Bernardetiaceae bacterium]MDW8205309.1 aminoacyl-tRNA hydrolase [Cytophagales bacterium]